MIFHDFTQLYNLSKTIRIALIPTPTTLQQINNSDRIETDKGRNENYYTIKSAIDRLHQDFISEALKNIVVEEDELEKYVAIVTDKKSRKREVETAARPILRKFEAAYRQTNEDWTAAYELKKPFTSTPEAQLKVLGLQSDKIANDLQLPPQELAKMVARFDGFSAYFSAYHLNRLNVYAPELKATSCANRALQNLVRFAKNREKFQKYYAGKNILPAGSAGLFDMAGYQRFLSQSGIDEYNFQIGELHSSINQERQKQKLSKKDRHQLPFFETLYKQILTETCKALSFDQVKTREDFAELMHNLQSSLPDDLKAIQKHFMGNVVTVANPKAVFLNSRAVNGLLYSQTANAQLIKNFLPDSFGSRKKPLQPDDTAASNFLSVHDLFVAIDQAQSQEENSIIAGAKTANPSAIVWGNFCDDLREKIGAAETCLDDFTGLDKFGKQQQEIIKKTLDAYNDVYKMYTYFELRFKNEPVANLTGDEDFYAIFDEGKIFPVDKAERFSRRYDLARNWLTKKPYSLDKWVLKFDCGHLLTGWDVNKEPEKHGAILKGPDGSFHLIILTNEGKSALDRSKNPDLFAASDGWQKMEYKLLPGPNKMLPKCFFSKKYRESAGVPEHIDKLYKNGEFKKGDAFNIKSLHKLIDFYKDALAGYPGWDMYKFDFRPTEQYESIDQFYFDVELGGYKLDFVPVNHAVLEKAEKEGLLYMFRITNKDLKNPNCKKPNLHTLYFLEAFQPDSTIKLNGEAEIFFRPKSLEPEYKKDEDDNLIRTPQGDKVIANRRFTQDAFTLHLPLTLNRKVKSISNAAFNQHAIERIKTNGVHAVIGIDRGEKHLTYIVIVDKDGKIIREPISFNTIPTYAGHAKDYWKKLSDLEAARRKDRQNWEAVRKIKDIKDGYVSYCVKKVVDLMIEHNAIVALENLNVGFKQGRAKIERNTYSQFEQALLEKLQYVVKKGEPAHAVMGAQNGLQLTPPDVSPGATNSHMGFVFYVDPSYTSQIDPVTGYRQQFRIDERVNVSTFTQFISGFDDIFYKDSNLLFTFNWKKLANAYNKLGKASKKQKDSVYPDKSWTITANVERSFYKKHTRGQDKKEVQTANCQEALQALLEANGISIQQNIKQQLESKIFTGEFVKRFVYHFNLTNCLRNNIQGKDAIISPVYPNGFDSTRDKLNGYDWNGDANGAYNIARKGVILLKKLQEAPTAKEFKCIVSRGEYDQFVGM